ncbi:MAG TPA: 2-C-methyl-D-erythritol 4-phosphate cytidylyltransferase [Acidimicrobiales bacterium]|jgi:2-C-methyl-D-erythritol 4-phosphate cytidylyltransferase|nr:2-C-methyl-D-erythritol 4-phosphate cytidylyltransferase [Acidimicrobiales bacterium]
MSQHRAPAGIWTVVVAAGSGSRFGAAKQYEPLGDRRVVDWSLAAASEGSAGVVLVVAGDRLAREAGHAAEHHAGRVQVVAGAATRSGSVRAGLAAVPAHAEVIVVHDAARPLAPERLFAAVVQAIRDGADAALPAVPVTDTIRRVDGGVVDRAELVAVQTPQAFAAHALRSAHRDDPEASDDAALVEAAGGKVVIVPGDPINLKITDPLDLVVARVLLAQRDAQ